MGRSTNSAIADLLTSNMSQPAEIYSRILDELGKSVGQGFGISFHVAESEGGLFYDAVCLQGTGDSEGAFLERRTSGAVLEGPLLKVHHPRPKEISTFISAVVDDNFKKSPVYEGLFKPLSIHSFLRINVYSGTRFVGQVGSYHRGDDRICTAKTLKKVRALQKPICAALTAADTLRRAELPESTAHVVLLPTGEVEFASPGAIGLITASRRDRLRQAVRNLDAGDLSQCVCIADGIEVRLTRMEGAGLFRYLAILTTATVPFLDPLSVLTSTQRQVAEYAAAGATVNEIARTLQRSPHTVKVHLKNIYERLGIASRLELATVLNSSNDEGR